MSRRTYPNRLLDHLGNDVLLPVKPFATGGEGAVFDVIGRPDQVAKLYSKPQSRERCDKLGAMAKLCNPDLLKIAAWPTATLNTGNPSAVEGILMPRIADHKEIHHLYSVAQRKKDFPEADWGFLVHTARNCAIAFENVHAHGHVVGDVNQKNVMVSKKGVVALVDCDSFQVKEANRIFRCGVGVPEYTPPELHGKKFTDLDRDASHDLFGLAVMVFHLLMMGRHPFAGVPQVNVDIPIEKAIQAGFYAYARKSNTLKPPPHVPPLTMLDAPTRELFERAFNSRQRPTATEWRFALDASMKGLRRCTNDPKHSYPAADNCPWCQLIAASRLMFFIPSQGAAGSTLRMEDIRDLIQKLANMQPAFPSYTRPRPRQPVQVNLPPGLHANRKPALPSHPSPPMPLQKPVLLPLPPLPTFLDKPALVSLPTAQAVPLAPTLKAYPPTLPDLPLPKLHTNPPPPVYPPIPPAPISDDSFFAKLSVAGALGGVLVFFIAKPVGVIMMTAFSMWWLSVKVTQGMRRNLTLKSLKEEHAMTCAKIDHARLYNVHLVEKANRQLLDAWKAAGVARAVEHARLCKAVDEQNGVTIAPWQSAKAAIEATHQRNVEKVQLINRRLLNDWDADNRARQTTYDQARRMIELENQGITSVWEAKTASRLAEHRRICDAVDAKNRQIIAAWEVANAPWIGEQNRWRYRASIAEATMKKQEGELMEQRRIVDSRFQHRKVDVQALLKSHEGVMQDYDRDIRSAEMDSKKLQLEEHLDKWLIRPAKIKGITSERILSLESFGIETAKDVAILKHQKVPGIGPVLSQRLFDWREKLALSFRPRHCLPESERRRVATRYAPVLLPLVQSLQSAINDLGALAASHRVNEAERITGILAAVHDLAVAEEHVRAMNVV